MSESQAVAEETNAESQTQTEDQGALEDVDSLLNEWETNADSATESQSQTTETESKGEQPDETKELLNYVREERETRIRQQTEQDVQKAVETIRDGLESPVPDELVEGYLYRQAAKDGRFLSAFQSRHKEPEKWNRLVKAISGDLNKSLSSQVDQTTTQDRDAVASAVRSASKAPAQSEEVSEADLQKMSDAEFFKLKRETLGQG